VTAGETVTVTLELDAEPRTVDVPADLARALKAAGARDAFERLAPSHRKEHVRAIEEAKRPETRAKRMAKTVEAGKTPSYAPGRVCPPDARELRRRATL
jgi:uncharacterized protein YdeI (YjbR/CyaY-like superfamily)